jgi:hypothetical protein
VAPTGVRLPAGRRGKWIALYLPKAACQEQINSCVKRLSATRSIPMMDILMVALGFGFFALAIGYTYACERL